MSPQLVPALLAACLAVTPLAVALRRLITLSLALPTHPGPLRRTLPRTSDAVRKRIDALTAALVDDPLGAMLAALSQPDGRARDAELNEALDDLDRRLGGATSQRGAYLRVYAFGGIFVCTVAVLLGGVSASSLAANGLPLAGMLAVAAWSFWLVDRWSAQLAREARADLDGLVELALSRTGAPAELFAPPEAAGRGPNPTRRSKRLDNDGPARVQRCTLPPRASVYRASFDTIESF